MRAAAAAILVAAITCAPPPVVRADTPGAAEAAAQLHLDRGVAAFRAHDYALAHRELQAARELAPDRPNPYRWLALTEVQLGDCAPALVNIGEFLARVPSTDPRVPEMIRLRALCGQARAPAVIAPTAEPPRRSPRRRPWLWPAIFGATIGVGVAAAIVFTRDADPARLPAVRCDATGCRPEAP
jgi:hypothetical protein